MMWKRLEKSSLFYRIVIKNMTNKDAKEAIISALKRNVTVLLQ